MRSWIILGSSVALLGLGACNEPAPAEHEEAREEARQEVSFREGELSPTETERPAGSEGAAEGAKGAAQHAPPEHAEVDPGQLPEERTPGAAQHGVEENIEQLAER